MKGLHIIFKNISICAPNRKNKANMAKTSRHDRPIWSSRLENQKT